MRWPPHFQLLTQSSRRLGGKTRPCRGARTCIYGVGRDYSTTWSSGAAAKGGRETCRLARPITRPHAGDGACRTCISVCTCVLAADAWRPRVAAASRACCKPGTTRRLVHEFGRRRCSGEAPFEERKQQDVLGWPAASVSVSFPLSQCDVIDCYPARREARRPPCGWPSLNTTTAS